MGLFDRFRAQPRWKNSSPAIRLAAVEELPLDQQDILVAIARDDRDANVRTAALKKVISPAIVADIARGDADDRVKEQATALLIDVACGEFEGTDQVESLEALAGLTDPKHVLAVARGASAEAVARAALARLHDPGALGSTARRSLHAAVRLEALSRVEDEAELVAVAVRGDYKDVTTAAVDRLTTRERLEDVASRAKNKTAAKRARTRIREMDAAVEEAERDAQSQTAPPTPEEIELAARRRKAAAICQRLEALVGTPLDEGEGALTEAERAWEGMALPEGDELASRFAAAVAAVQTALATTLAERAERARLAQALADAITARRSLCETVNAAAGEDGQAQLDEARAAWSALPACPDEAEAGRWARRFEDACRAAEARQRAALALRGRREKAARVCADLERLAASAEFPRMRGEWQGLRRAWSELAASGFDDESIAARVKQADARLQEREVEAHERRAREQQENLVRLQKLCAEVEAVAAAHDLTLKGGERALKDARSALDEGAPLPSRDDQAQIATRLEQAMSALFPRVQELRDMDDWQRWANAGVQEEICQKVEKLLEVEDLASVARQLREAQARWKQVATAPRDQSQVLWNRFKAASDAVRAKCEAYFAQVATEQAANQAAKETLCQKAEALSDSSDWIRTAEAIKALQAEWKTIGPAPRAQEKALWDRFHAACDAFFTRRRDDLQHRKEDWAVNLEKKEALCARAEAIAETTDWPRGVEEIKRLQAEWKTVGPVRKARAEAVWQRFRAACDRFFERYQQRDQLAASAVVVDGEAALQAFEALLPTERETTAPPENVAQQAMDLRARWVAVAASLPRERALRMADRYTKVITRLVEAWPSSFVGTDWDPEANLRKMEDLCVQVEQLMPQEPTSGQIGAPVEPDEESPATLLARQLREALATNTIAGRQEESLRWKAAAEDLRNAQAAWKRIGPVPEAAARALNARFQKACARAAEKIEQRKRGVAAR